MLYNRFSICPRLGSAGLHSLKGDLKGYRPVIVTGNYRIIFRFENGDAHLVDLDPLKVNITALADNLGVARKTISQLVNGHMGVSAEMALKLAKAFNTTPELCLNMQRNYDLWEAGARVNVNHAIKGSI